jgi:hypothetical protein
MTTRSAWRPTLAVAGLAIALFGCDDPATGPTAPDFSAAAPIATLGVTETADPLVASWLAGLRASTAAFHRSDVAADAGWGSPITGCMETTGVGGMGYHYANVDLIDGVAEALAPEILLYEPDRNGRLRLVGVEYIIPFSFVPDDATPPSLNGVAFHQNYTFGLWALHAWVWKHNPDGVFSDWNPSVRCAFAQ